jgi:hypothetical protein
VIHVQTRLLHELEQQPQQLVHADNDKNKIDDHELLEWHTKYDSGPALSSQSIFFWGANAASMQEQLSDYLKDQFGILPK